jgi:hypothetical protein
LSFFTAKPVEKTDSKKRVAESLGDDEDKVLKKGKVQEEEEQESDLSDGE